jgi:hypothetical protein
MPWEGAINRGPLSTAAQVVARQSDSLSSFPSSSHLNNMSRMNILCLIRLTFILSCLVSLAFSESMSSLAAQLFESNFAIQETVPTRS